MPTFPAYITATIAPRSRYIVGTPGSATLQVFAEPPVIPEGVGSLSNVGSVGLGQVNALSPVAVTSASAVPSISVGTDIVTDYGVVTPEIFVGTQSYWNSGISIPAGTYRVDYVIGWWRPNSSTPNYYCVQHSFDGLGPYIKYNGGSTQLRAPGIVGNYASSALCEAANAGTSAQFTHTGGTISAYLYDNNYASNDGPGITIRLTRLA